MRIAFEKFLLLSVLLSGLQSFAEVRVWEGTLQLIVYDEGQPDVNPPFDEIASAIDYPYTLRENLTDRKTQHNLRAVYLENEYLKCVVLPDLGGHLYTCTDKINGQSMFYANPSIKKARISLRGAWAAFGIEFNFPVSHNWVSLSPVDYAFSTQPDGGASVTVGNIDRVYGMEWTVELVLRPRSTVLEERVTLSNRSDVRHRFYWWNNAAVQVWNDSQICLPTLFMAAHGFAEVDTWPVNLKGKDLSIVGNQTDGTVSRFMHETREPFFGVWHPKTNAGVVHYADYGELPAKKLWSWGADTRGKVWRKALSDNDSAYIELQAGLFRNQETYAYLEPRQSLQFSEYWMPVREIGGVTRANLAGALNLSRSGDKLIAALNVNQSMAGATVRLMGGNSVLRESTLDLSPGHTWSTTLAATEKKYTFELRDSAGAVRLRHTEREYDWTPPREVNTGRQARYEIPEPAARTEDDWLQQGDREESNGTVLRALASYEEALRKYPTSYSLCKAAGRLTASLGRYEEAVRFLEPLADRNTTDAEIAYYLGIAYEGIGRDRKARFQFESARRMPELRAAASVRLAEFLSRQGDLQGAISSMKVAIESAPGDARAHEELVALLRAADEGEAAQTLAETSHHRFPTSYFLSEELGTPELAHLAADPYRILNVAEQYMRLGLFEAAFHVLARQYPPVPADQMEPASIAPSDHPLIVYYRAYCEQKLQRPAAQEFAAAARLTTQYVFPSGPQVVAVLRSALQSHPEDANAHFLLGSAYVSQGQNDAGLGEWEKARASGAKISTLDVDMGRILLRIRKQPENALAAFRRGLQDDPRNAAVYLGIDQTLSLLCRPAQERIAALEAYPDPANMPQPLVFELALNRAESEDFAAARATFEHRTFISGEGDTDVRQVWLEIRLQEALSLGRARQCGPFLAMVSNLAAPVPSLDFTHDGLQSLLENSRTHYLVGEMESKCGETQRAQASFTEAAKGANAEDITWAARATRRLLGSRDAAVWKQRLSEALVTAKANSLAGGRDTSFWFYNVAILERELGDQAADASLDQALLLPDRQLVYHLCRLARLVQGAPASAAH